MPDLDRQKTSDTGRADARPVSPFRAGVKFRCPHCGEGPLFDGILTVRPVCAVCGFDLQAADPGDGPAVFVILILGAVTAIAAFAVEGLIAPPRWVHLILWPVFISGMGLWLLRIFKATLIALQFHHDAHEGRVRDDGDVL